MPGGCTCNHVHYQAFIARQEALIANIESRLRASADAAVDSDPPHVALQWVHRSVEAKQDLLFLKRAYKLAVQICWNGHDIPLVEHDENDADGN